MICFFTIESRLRYLGSTKKQACAHIHERSAQQANWDRHEQHLVTLSVSSQGFCCSNLSLNAHHTKSEVPIWSAVKKPTYFPLVRTLVNWSTFAFVYSNAPNHLISFEKSNTKCCSTAFNDCSNACSAVSQFFVHWLESSVPNSQSENTQNRTATKSFSVNWEPRIYGLIHLSIYASVTAIHFNGCPSHAPIGPPCLIYLTRFSSRGFLSNPGRSSRLVSLTHVVTFSNCACAPVPSIHATVSWG